MSRSSLGDTIYARSSGAGRAGVSVFRLSGPKAGAALTALAGSTGTPRAARLATLRLPDGTILDQGLTIWFPGPRSFTGDDVAELHLHGSLAVERALYAALDDLGLVPATAGAFTLRAFENGKLDLVQAEGLGDLLSAETEGQRRHALGQLGGRLSELADRWRGHLVELLARLTAVIDFPEEEDVPSGVADDVTADIRSLISEMEKAVAEAGASLRLREGVRVVLTGPPNAGKSSLLNALAEGEHAIVSDVAGTTRDVIEVRIERRGQLITLVDTAGVRETTDTVERIGVRRAVEAATTADVRLVLLPATDIAHEAPDDGHVYVATKADLRDGAPPNGWIPASVVEKGGIDALMSALDNQLVQGVAGPLTRQRHVQLVTGAMEALERASRGSVPELVASDLSVAVERLEELVGRVSPDALLGEVFSAFCIGK